MVEEKYIVIGAGGHAKVVLDVLKLNKKNIAGLTDPNVLKGELCMGYSILGNDDELPGLYEKGICHAVMGIGHVGYPAVRNKVYKIAKQIGYEFSNCIHPTAVIAETVQLGEGNLLAAGVVINADACIGDLSIINTSAVIEHEVQIGNGVHIAPHATVLGQAVIGDNSFIGAGSVILQGVHIGKNCIIGAGSIVLRDVEDDCVVVGNPGRVLKRR